jgi:hypothetical protein
MKKFLDKYWIFKYILAYVLTMGGCFLFLFLCELIPYKWVEKNVVDSIHYHNEEFFKHRPKVYETYDIAEISMLEMNYLSDSKHPYKSLVENNVLKGSFNPEKRDKAKKEEYARYWYGMQGYERILFLFTNYKGVRVVNAIILLVLSIILIIKLYKESKAVMLSFILGIIMCSFFFVYKSVSFTSIPIIALIGSIIIINMYHKKSKNIGLFFFTIALFAGFFDAITVESLTLSLPLFIYCYLNIRDNKKIGLMTCVKYFCIWFLAFMIMMASKWVLTVGYYGTDYIEYLKYRSSMRLANENHYNYDNMFTLLGGMFSMLFPFCTFKYGYVVTILILVFFVFNFVIYLDKKKYLPLIFAACVPLIRFGLFFSHAEQLYRFTFRALLPLIMFILFVCIKQIENIVVNKKEK